MEALKRLKYHTIEDLFFIIKKLNERGIEANVEIKICNYHNSIEDVYAKLTIPDGSYYGQSLRMNDIFNVEQFLLNLNKEEREKAKSNFEKICVVTEKSDKIIIGLLASGPNSNVVDIED